MKEATSYGLPRPPSSIAPKQAVIDYTGPLNRTGQSDCYKLSVAGL